jgi:hypothetical protein
MINNITDNWSLRRENQQRSGDHVWCSRMFNERKILQLVRPEDNLQLPDRNGHEGTETP